jgi:fluoroquinolone transport system permease protein
MKRMPAWAALGLIDAKSISRDPMLLWIVFYPLGLGLMIRLGLPLLESFTVSRFGLSLTPYHPLLMSFFLLTAPMLAGIVIGFLLLDQRDDQTILALQVTPLTLNGYLVYRLFIPALLTTLIAIFLFPIAGVLKVNWFEIIVMSLGVILLAPCFSLTLAAFASNKVQGFAVSKAQGILLVAPVLAYFVDPPLQWVFGLVPIYWPAKVVWLIYAGQPPWYFLLTGVLYQAVLLFVLTRRFNKIMYL